MTIRRGEAWGEPVVLSPEVPIVDSDARFGALATAARVAGTAIPEIALRSGDLARTLGGGAADRVVVGATVVRAPIDLLRIRDDGGRTIWCAAHLVARRSWWHGRVVVVANAQYLDGRDVAPRSHPNDGRLDVLDVRPTMSVRDRLRARRRSATGTHVPHPDLLVHQSPAVRLEFDRPMTVWVDGVRWGTTRAVEVEVEPDAAIVHA